MPSNPEVSIKGIVPALDRRQVGERFIADGRNFLVDAQGPYSAFGVDFQTFAQLIDWSDAKVVTIERQTSFILTNKAIFQQDKTTERVYPIFVFATATTERFPWSCAKVGGEYYFVKKGLDVIQYNPILNSWKQLTSANTPGIPPLPYALVASSGRLFIAAEAVVSWSAIDNGEIYEDVPLGAGSQSLAIIGNGTPLGIHHTELGVITYTTEGAMFSRKIEAPNPYRHRPFSEHFTPISPYCILEIADGLHIFVDQTGLYQNNGQQIQPWQPLMGEFLHRTILQEQFDFFQNNNPQIRLFFDRNRNWFFISIAETSQVNVYQKAFVLYVPRNEWGLFNHEHVLIDELVLEAGIDVGFNLGFFDKDGFYNRFSNTNRNQIKPDVGRNIYFQPTFQLPNCNCPGVSTPGGDIIEMTVYDRSVLTNPGLYDETLTAIPATFSSVDAFVDIGLFRLVDQISNDLFSRMIALTLGFAETVPIESEDWLLQFTPDISEDWNALSGSEDWGEGISTGLIFDVLLMGTIDGKNIFENQSETPEIAMSSPEANYYTCDNNGIWHIIRIDARKVEQGFHIKYMEPVLIPAGKT